MVLILNTVVSIALVNLLNVQCEYLVTFWAMQEQVFGNLWISSVNTWSIDGCTEYW